MSLEQQVIELTQATEQLLQAVNTRKADLDAAESAASSSANIASNAKLQAESAADLAFNQANLAEAAADRTQSSESNALIYSQNASNSANTAAINANKTTQDVILTAADRLATAADRVQTSLDRLATADDRTAVDAARIQTNQDRIQTGLDRQSIAADKVFVSNALNQSNINVAATAADRIQTGLDVQITNQNVIVSTELRQGIESYAEATAADRIATGLDVQATAADRIQTGLDVVQTNADKETTNLYKIASEESAGLSRKYAENPEDEPVVDEEYSAKHWFKKTEIAQGIAGSFATSAVDAAQQAQQAAADAVAVVTGGTASLTPQAGKIPIAGASGKINTEWLDPLPGVTAEALHRSPEAVTSIFVYDTSKDSDGGAWTEKCQHTSWYNEPINGKWLGAADSETQARYAFTATGSELTNNPLASSTGWTLATGWSISNGQLVGAFTPSTSGSATLTLGTEANKWYAVTLRVSKTRGFVAVRAGSGGTSVNFNENGTATVYVQCSGATPGQIAISSTASSVNYFEGSISLVSVREVTAQTTQSGDYFQLTTNGKFYKLNATSGISEVFRGNKREFPKLSAIVAEASNVTIYDLTEPGRPMWMRYLISAPNTAIYGGAARSVYCSNSMITVGGNNVGLYVGNFVSDSQYRYSTNNNATRYLGSGIADRNTKGWTSGSMPYIANALVNAVAMTVLPDAPVDPVTGLRIPTIAVATGGGVSVINHNGSVVSRGSGAFTNVTITSSLLSAGKADADWYYALSPGSLGVSFTLSTATGEFGRGNTAVLKNANRTELVRSSGALVTKRENNLTNSTNSINATLTNTFNTGHQPGDIRRTYLSDIDAGSVTTGPELITNGAFDTDVSGWDVLNPSVATISWNSSGAIDLIFVATGTCLVYRNVSGLVSGKTYLLSVNIVSDPGTDYIYIGTSVYPSGTYSGVTDSQASTGGLRTLRFVASQASMVVHFGAYGSAGNKFTWDNVSVKEVVSDRSYKARGAYIEGTLTKSPVSTGSQLVAYSGFSAANYLREPYSADLDFGTGEWSVGAWVNLPTSLPSVLAFPTNGNSLPINGTFDSDILGWTASAGVLSLDAGRLKYYRPAGVASDLLYSVQNLTSAGIYARLSFDYELIGSAGLGVGYINFDPYSYELKSIPANTSGHIDLIIKFNGNTGRHILFQIGTVGSGDTTLWLDNVTVTPIGPLQIMERGFSSGMKINLGMNGYGNLTATAYDGTTTRTVTTPAVYNTGTWLKAEACYTTDGTLSIRVNGQEVAATRGNPLLTLNNSNAVLTIGNSYNLDAPFPGSLALLKLSATVPTAEQSQWMYEQEKQMFRENAKVCLPDSGNIVDLAYDDATDTWIAASASNISEWSGLVRTNVTPVPAGSYSKVSAASGVKLAARTTTSPGVDITIPASTLKEELVRRNEAAAKMSQQLAIFDYTCGFTASTTTGNTAITAVSGLSYPQSYIGAKVTGTGIPADTVVQGVSGTTIYLSKAATATATGVQISFNDYVLPVGYEAKTVMQDGAVKQEGSTKTYTRLFDGFKETIRFAVAPSYQAWVQIQATRSVQ